MKFGFNQFKIETFPCKIFSHMVQLGAHGKRASVAAVLLAALPVGLASF